ncbi:MAG: hypothetical protein RI949_273, partial [Pseudomonadota bacterium]
MSHRDQGSVACQLEGEDLLYY